MMLLIRDAARKQRSRTTVLQMEDGCNLGSRQFAQRAPLPVLR
jgi:hypothetical protein